MATFPIVSTQGASAVVTSTLLNNHRDALQYSLGITPTGGGGRRALFIGSLTVAQSLPTSGTDAALGLDSESLDYDSSHSTVTNTTRYTGLTAGWYYVLVAAQFASNATGYRQVGIGQNGSTPGVASASTVPAVSGAATLVQASSIVQLNGSTDYFEARALQTSGGALNVTFARLYVWLMSA